MEREEDVERSGGDSRKLSSSVVERTKVAV